MLNEFERVRIFRLAATLVGMCMCCSIINVAAMGGGDKGGRLSSQNRPRIGSPASEAGGELASLQDRDDEVGKKRFTSQGRRTPEFVRRLTVLASQPSLASRGVPALDTTELIRR